PDAGACAETAEAGADTTCRIEGFGGITAATAERLSCEALISGVIKGADGDVLMLGRSKRLVSRRQTRAERSRRLLPISRVPFPQAVRRPPHPALVAGWGDRSGQSHPALPTPPHRGAQASAAHRTHRGRLRGSDARARGLRLPPARRLSAAAP